VPRAIAVVVTDAPARYAKQLLAHLGRKREVQPLDGAPDGGTLVFDDGRGHVRPGAAALVLEAVADDADGLAHVQDVLGRHLERFGARRELVVDWQPRGDGVREVRTEAAPTHDGPLPQAVVAGSGCSSPRSSASTRPVGCSRRTPGPRPSSCSPTWRRCWPRPARR
jgi:hypothetical protein